MNYKLSPMNKSILFFVLNLFFVNIIYAQKSVNLNPSSGVPGQNLSVSITGVKTNFGVGSNTLQFFKQGTSTNKIVVSNYAVVSPTTILASLFIQGSATTGAYTYKLNNPIDGTVDGLNPFYVYPDTSAPKLVSISPSTIQQSEYLNVTITGSNTHFTQASSSMQIAFYHNTKESKDLYIPPNSIEILDDTHFTAFIMATDLAKLGKYDITISNTIDGYLPLLNSITVIESNMPRIVSVNPNLGHLNQTLKISITGARTNFTKGSPTVSFFQNGSPTSEIQINSYSLKNDSLLDVNIFIKSTANRGLYAVVYDNQSDYLFKESAFEVTWALGAEDIVPLADEVTIYPNPVHEIIHLETRTAIIEKVEIMDIQGRLVQTNIPEKPDHKVDFRVDEYLNSQQYLIIKITTNKGIFFQRILIQ